MKRRVAAGVPTLRRPRSAPQTRRIQAADAPVPALKLKQLKDFLRQKAKEKPISHVQLVAVKAVLPEGYSVGATSRSSLRS